MSLLLLVLPPTPPSHIPNLTAMSPWTFLRSTSQPNIFITECFLQLCHFLSYLTNRIAMQNDPLKMLSSNAFSRQWTFIGVDREDSARRVQDWPEGYTSNTSNFEVKMKANLQFTFTFFFNGLFSPQRSLSDLRVGIPKKSTGAANPDAGTSTGRGFQLPCLGCSYLRPMSFARGCRYMIESFFFR